MRCYMRCHYGYIRDEALDWYRHGIDYRKKTCSQRSTTLLFVKSVLTSVFRNKRKSIVQSLMAWQNAGFIPPVLAVQWMLKERERDREKDFYWPSLGALIKLMSIGFGLFFLGLVRSLLSNAELLRFIGESSLPELSRPWCLRFFNSGRVDGFLTLATFMRQHHRKLNPRTINNRGTNLTCSIQQFCLEL